MGKSWTALATLLLLAGCSQPSGTPNSDPGEDSLAGPTTAALTALRFASGDFEATDGFDATFSSLDTCLVTCTATASQSFDLTALVPPAAPVELVVTLDGGDGGISAFLVYADASASRESQDFQGTSIHLAATLVRDDAGTVTLQITHAFPIAPSLDPVVVRVDARAVVRADQLLPAIAASVSLKGGDTVAVAGPDVTQALLMAPDGTAQRARAPELNITVPIDSPAGKYVLLVEGGPAAVLGPNTTLTARRLATTYGDWQTLSMGTEANWDLEVPAVPLRVGLVLRSAQGSSSANPFVGSFQVKVTGPDAALLVEGTNQGCDLPFCQGGYFSFTFATPFMDDRLSKGTYHATALVESGDAVEAAQFYVAVL